MVEIVIEKPLPPDAGDHGAEDRSHPEQRQQTLIQADAAEAGEGDQDEQADSKPNQDLGRSQSSRQVRPMLHGGPASGEIAAADRLVESVGAPRCARHAGPA